MGPSLRGVPSTFGILRGVIKRWVGPALRGVPSTFGILRGVVKGVCIFAEGAFLRPARTLRFGFVQGSAAMYANYEGRYLKTSETIMTSYFQKDIQREMCTRREKRCRGEKDRKKEK